VKIALAQINPTVGDFSGNTHKILDYAARAAALGADLVMLPELSLCGYPPADFLEKAAFLDRAQHCLAEIAHRAAGSEFPAILLGTALASGVKHGKHARNVAALLNKGEIRFLQQKMLLPFYDVFDEQRYFEPATQQKLVTVKGQPLAITICEDAWNDKSFWPRRLYPIDPVEELMRQWPDFSPSGAQPEPPRIILNLSASPYWQNKRGLRHQMLAALARRHNAFVAMVNQVGGNDSLIFDGSSIVLAPGGHLLSQADSFREDLILFDTEAPAGSAPSPSASTLPVPTLQHDEIAATWEALVLGTRDYVRKCGFKKALVGLSGGIDSALVAAIAVEALGAENVHGIGMPSEYSSPVRSTMRARWREIWASPSI